MYRRPYVKKRPAGLLRCCLPCTTTRPFIDFAEIGTITHLGPALEVLGRRYETGTIRAKFAHDLSLHLCLLLPVFYLSQCCGRCISIYQHLCDGRGEGFGLILWHYWPESAAFHFWHWLRL